MDYNIKDQIIEQDDKLRWGSLLKDLSKEGFVKKQGKIYIWIDSNKYMGKFCEFVKENLFYYPDHAFYLYFIPIFKNKDGEDFTREQLGKYKNDYNNSRTTVRWVSLSEYWISTKEEKRLIFHKKSLQKICLCQKIVVTL